MFEILTRGIPSHPLDGIIINTAELKNYVQNQNHKPALPRILQARVTPDGLEELHIKRLSDLYRQCSEYHPSKRPTFSYLATEIRSLYDFIGRNQDSRSELNFEIVQTSSEYAVNHSTGYYRHVSNNINI